MNMFPIPRPHSRPFRAMITALLFMLGSTAAQAESAGRTGGELRTYIFGHSLINNNSGPSAVPYWLTQLARADKKRFAFAGQYGFLWQHVESLPPVAQWHFDGAPSFWNHETQSFADANFNAILLTPANFIQWQAPTIVDRSASNSPVGDTLSIIDWVMAREPGIDIYIYENWPNMSAYLGDGNFPPTAAEFAKYNAYTLGPFHDWWADYDAALSAARPNVKFIPIPVGPTIAKMLTSTNLLAGIPVTDLYYDEAPHGTPTLYFLASLVTYSGMYEKPAPTGFAVPKAIHPVVRKNYRAIVQFIAAELGVG